MTGHLSQELADEFAVGALDEAAADAVSQHISTCEPCARLVSESDRVAAALLLGITRAQPPERLRGRVFRRAGILRPGPLIWGARLATAGAGIAAVVIAVAAFTGMVSLRGQVNNLKDENVELRSQLQEALSQRIEIAALTLKLDDQARDAAQIQATARQDRELLVALLSPDSRVAEVYSVNRDSFAIGRLVWDPEQRRVWFVGSRLDRLADGESYQLWVDADGTYVSLGSFNADNSGFARFQALVPQGVEGYDNAVVTIEQGTAGQLSGPAVFVADLSQFRR
jgi:anti-sigma-K factor RskA